MQLAWITTGARLAFTDFYVMAVAAGWISDLRTVGAGMTETCRHGPWLLENIERHEYDVVVIGAGGAGLRAAIEARAAGQAHGDHLASHCSARRTR